MEQRMDHHEEPDHVVTLADENTDIGYCLFCRDTFVHQESDDHSGCPTRLLSTMVADANSEYAAWQQFQSEVPNLIQNQFGLVDDAADSAIVAMSSIIRAKAEELKSDVLRSCSQESLSRILGNQMGHIERLTELRRFDRVQDINYLKSLHQVANTVPYPPPQNCGTLYPAVSEVKALAKFLFLGRVLGGLDNKQFEAARRIEGQDGIHKAAERGCEELVELHISKDDNSINSFSEDLLFCGKEELPTTPLIVAVKHGHVGVVSLLLAANAQVDLADGSGCSPLHVAFSNMISWECISKCQEGQKEMSAHQEIFHMLLGSRADVNKFWESETVFHRAINVHREDVVTALLEAKANVNLKTRGRDEEPCIILARDNLPILRLLCETTNCCVSSRNARGQTALQIAIASKKNNVAEYLRSKGAK